MRDVNGKMARTKTGTTPLPAQSRCTWNGHVTKAILGEKNTALQEMHVDTSQEPFF
jgi:hypothetical protein